MSDVVNYTEIYSQHVELLPGRTMLIAGAPGAATPPGDSVLAEAYDVADDGGFDSEGGVDDDGPGGVVDDGGNDSFGGVDDGGPDSEGDDDGGFDRDGGVDDDGDQDGDGVR